MNEIDTTYEILRILKNVKESIRLNFKEQFKDENLTGTQGMLVGILGHHGGMKISDLSKKMCLSNSTISGIIDRLEKNGFVERKRSKEDRRVVIVDLTKEFKEEWKCHFKVLESYVSKIINYATSEEMDEVLNGLKTLDELINRFKEEKNNKE
ncbi:MarR family winged helix-turn-helix transcriptional regulator [Clostridium sp. DL1XJH146]